MVVCFCYSFDRLLMRRQKLVGKYFISLPYTETRCGFRSFLRSFHNAVALLNSLPTDAIEQRPTGFARTAKVVLLNGQSK